MTVEPEIEERELADVHLAILMTKSDKTQFDNSKTIADYLKLIKYPDKKSSNSDSFYGRWLLELGKNLVINTFDQWTEANGLLRDENGNWTQTPASTPEEDAARSIHLKQKQRR